MSTGRVLWIIWCLAWAAFWFFMGFATVGLAWIATAGSIACIWIPVGKPPRDRIAEVMRAHDQYEDDWRRLR